MIAYNEAFSPVERLLILSLKEERNEEERRVVCSLYEQLGDDTVHQAAVINKVVPMVAHGLIDSVPSGALIDQWRVAHSDIENKLTAFIVELDRLAEVCHLRSIRIVAIENGGIARGVQKCRGCFASSDIEILINPEQLGIFEQILVEEGYERRSRERCASEKADQWDRDIRGWDNYCKQLPGGHYFWLNVQWRAVLRRWVPMEIGLETRDLLARSVPIEDVTSRVRILSPEDNLLVCALHVASHSYVRGIGLRLQLDVDRLIRNVDLDWDLFHELVSRHRAAELVFPALAIPTSIFGTPTPKRVFSLLIASGQKRKKILELIARAGIMNRDDYKFSAREMVQLEMALSPGGAVAGLRRVLVPPVDWIREGYKSRGHNFVVTSYVVRFIDLVRRKQA